MRRKIFSILLSVAMVMVMMPSMAFATGPQDATIEVSTADELIAVMAKTAENPVQYKNLTVNINKDISLKGKDWTSAFVNGYNGAEVYTINGNGHKITDLTGALFDSTWAGKGQLIINDLTIADSTMTGGSADHGFAAFLGHTEATALIQMSNCHVINCNITGADWTGGLIGYAAGYNKEDDGPVSEYIKLKDCSVEESTITGAGSTGAIFGHATGNVATYVTIEGCTVEGNKVTCTDDSDRKAGSIMGTVGVGTVTVTNAKVVNNTVKSNGVSNNRIAGRFGSAGTLNVSGGIFADCNRSEFDLPDAGTGTLNFDEEHAPQFKVVASIGDKKYETLEAALEAVKDGETITLLEDCNGNGISVPSGKIFTVDFNGYTYTITGPTLAGSSGTKNQCFQLLKNSTITFKNGRIVADNSGIKMMIQNYSNLTLQNMTLDATQGTNNVNYVVSNNCGNVSIEGQTSIIAKTGGRAFDVYYWPSNGYTEGVNVTIDTTGTITGIVEYGSDKSAGAAEAMHDKASLTIKKGTFNGSISTYDCNENPNISITGGTFDTKPAAEYIASGYEVTESNSKFTVSKKYVAPPTPVEKDPVSNEGTAGTDDATTSADITDKVTTSEGKTEAVVDQNIADKIVDKAVENKSTEVVVEATTAAGKSDASQVALPESTVKAIAEKTDAAITIKTDNAEVTLDKEAVNAVADHAGTTGTVKLVVETVENTDEKVVVELKLETSNGYVSDFKGGNVSVTVPVAKDMADKKVVCVYIDDNGIYHKVDGAMNEAGTHYTFTTGHFSTYAIMSEEEADAVIKDQTAAAQKAAIKNVKTTVTLSTKNVKKGIKVTVKVPVDQKADKTGIILYRSMKKDSGYAMYKKVETKSSTYIITNTKNVKGNRLTAGKRYYYKARAYKVIDGKTYYGPMSTVKYMKAK